MRDLHLPCILTLIHTHKAVRDLYLPNTPTLDSHTQCSDLHLPSTPELIQPHKAVRNLAVTYTLVIFICLCPLPEDRTLYKALIKVWTHFLHSGIFGGARIHMTLIEDRKTGRVKGVGLPLLSHSWNLELRNTNISSTFENKTESGEQKTSLLITAHERYSPSV